jgi:phosphoribosyl-dephospho-CoA transferase
MMARPHDLLFLHGPADFQAAEAPPDWRTGAWATAPLVVRRAATPAGTVPVGARGPRRNQRCAGTVAAAAIARCVTPAALAAALRALPAARPHQLPCLHALHALAPRLDALGLDWGPAGGVGFWLASGLPVLHAASDCDLLVRLPQPPDGALIEALCGLCAGQPCRIDIQVDTGAGGCALAELAELPRRGRILLKTAHGPQLSADPWRAASAA